MKFVKFNENNVIELIHNMPFDPVHGLHMSELELKRMGALVEEIPVEPEVGRGQATQFKYVPETNTVIAEIISVPLKPEEQMQVDMENMNAEIEASNLVQMELYEMVLANNVPDTVSAVRSISATDVLTTLDRAMIPVYVKAIQRGQKTLEQVPERIREQVRLKCEK